MLSATYANLDNGSKQQDYPFAIEVTFTNPYDVPVTLDSPKLTGELVEDLPILLDMEVIPPKDSRSFVFFLVGSHREQAATKVSSVLSGKVFVGLDWLDWDLQISEVIQPHKFQGKFALTSVRITPSTITLGETTELLLEFTNQGNAEISNLTLPRVALVETSGDCSFDKITLPVGSTYTKRIAVKPRMLGRIQYKFMGQDVSGSVQGSPVFGSGILAATVVVNGK